MKLQLLVVLAVVVLVPSLSEGRKVSICELKEKLGDAIVLHRRPIYYLTRVITEVEWRSDTRLDTSRVRVFGRPPNKTTLPRKRMRRSLQKLEKKMMLSLTLPPTTTATLPTTTTTLATTTTTLATTTTTLPTNTTTLPITTTTDQPDPTPLAVTGTNRPNPTPPAVTGTRPPTVVVETSPTIGSQTTQLQPRRAVIGTRAPTAGSDEEDGAPDEENGDSEVEENAGSDEEDAATDEENGHSEVEENTGSDEEDDGAPDEQNDDSEVEEDGGVDDEEDGGGGDDDEDDDVNEENTEEGGSRKKRSITRRGPWYNIIRPWIRRGGRWSIGFYGVFQLNDALHCNSGYRYGKNICKTDCSAFTDDDISDDIACFVKSRAWVRYFRLSRLRPRPRWDLRDCH